MLFLFLYYPFGFKQESKPSNGVTERWKHSGGGDHSNAATAAGVKLIVPGETLTDLINPDMEMWLLMLL